MSNYSEGEIKEIVKKQKEELDWMRYGDISGIEDKLFMLFKIIEDILERLDYLQSVTQKAREV